MRLRYSKLIVFATLLLGSPALLAQDAAGSAFGESVDLAIKVDPLLSLATVEAKSGPTPMVSASTPPPFAVSDSLLSVDVDANLKLVGILPAIAVGILETGLLEVSTSGDTSPQSDSSASVADVNLELLGVPDLPLVPEIPVMFGLDADAVTSTASATGSCGSTLTVSGSSNLVNASVISDLADLVGIDAGVLASPPANFILLEVNLLGGHIRVVLNEQIETGDGISSKGITVNAVHVTINQLPLAGIITDVTGDVIISQSKAEVTCSSADLSLTKTDSADPTPFGEPMFYTLTVENAGPDSAANVVVTDNLPAAFSFDSASASPSGSCAESSGVVTCDLGDIASGASATVTINGTPNGSGAMSNTASVTSDAADPDPSNDSDTESTTVTPAAGVADLSVIILDSADPVAAGETLTITLQVENDGPQDAINSVLVYDIPAGLTIDSVTGGSCNVTATQVICDLGTVLNGAMLEIEIEMTPMVPTTLEHHAEVSSDVEDDVPQNNTFDESTVVTVVQGEFEADMSIVKDASSDPIIGQPLTYTLTVLNSGPDNTDAVVVTDQLPAGVVFQSAEADQGSCSHTAGVVTCDLGAVLDQESVSITIVVIPQVTGEISNQAEVTSNIFDDDLTNNSDTADSDVGPGAADLSMDKTASVNPALVGDDFTYLLTIFNDGPNDATLVEVVDVLPASLIFVSAIPSKGTCDDSGQTVTCQLGTIVNQGSATVVITVTPTEAGTLSNTAVVDSQLDDPIPDDNDEEEVIEVDPRRADLSLTKSASSSPAFVDVPFDYTLTVLNNGPQEATLVELVDEIPASLVIGNRSASQGSCGVSGQTVTCDLGTIPLQGSVTVTIEVTPTALGTLSNTAVVDSATEDPDLSDNTATNTTEVATGRATFAVTKIFSDNNPSEVLVSIDCNTGLVLDQDKLISQEEGVIFVVTDYTSGAMTCTITETVPGGYAPEYNDGTTTNSESCQFEAIESNQDFSCVITNTVQPVTINIEKQWVFEGSGSAIDTGYDLVVSCDAMIVGGGAFCGIDDVLGENGYYCIRLQGEGDGVYPVEVIPEYPSSSCQVVEYPYDGSVEIDNGCEDLTISAGQETSCLITNSVFFEGIPVLDQRSMILLALLLAGMGIVAVRRVGA
jgi:uncharacterized repeat protein (TIGR01451 family)